MYIPYAYFGFSLGLSAETCRQAQRASSSHGERSRAGHCDPRLGSGSSLRRHGPDRRSPLLRLQAHALIVHARSQVAQRRVKSSGVRLSSLQFFLLIPPLQADRLASQISQGCR